MDSGKSKPVGNVCGNENDSSEPCTSAVVTSFGGHPFVQDTTPLCHEGNCIKDETRESSLELFSEAIDANHDCGDMAFEGDAGAAPYIIPVPVTAGNPHWPILGSGLVDVSE